MCGMSPARRPGRLIVFEGPDGVGKSTIASALSEAFGRRDQKHRLMTFPGKDPGTLGALIYQIHHDPGRFAIDTMSEAARQTLHIAAHLDAIERLIRPTIEEGTDVLLDRYWWSAWVYGLVGGMDRALLQGMISFERSAWDDLHPTLAILVTRQTPLRKETPSETWEAHVREYSRLARSEGCNHPVLELDNSGSVVEALEQIELALGSRPTKHIRRRVSPTGHGHLYPVRTTEVYDTYWRFAAERQEVFFRRINATPPPWTDDEVLRNFKFTNAYRASDRVSQFLIRSVIYRDDLSNSSDEVVFRTLLFKLFNKIETWLFLEESLGPITYKDFDPERYAEALDTRRAARRSIYSAAYIMPSVPSFGHPRKHRNHLELLSVMMDDGLPRRLEACNTMREAFELLRDYPSIGDFLAYQFVTDINYSEVTKFSEREFVVPGPGALDGIRKCFHNLGGLDEAEIIQLMADRQEDEFRRLGLSFRSLWGRPLQLIDCQNLFCEVDKYARVRHPKVQGRSGRTRIKQRFKQNPEPLTYWYPPKWGINDRIAASSPQPSARRR